METSSPGSRMRAAAMLSSSDRLAGCLPGACDRTTVSRCRLIAISLGAATSSYQVTTGAAGGLLPHLALQDPLRLVPVGGQEVVVLLRRQRPGRVAGHFEEPAAAVPVHVNRGRVP